MDVNSNLVVCLKWIYIYIGGSHGQHGILQQLILQEPTYGTYEEATRGLDEAVGPTGQVGRPARGSNRPQLRPASCPGLPCPNPMGLGLS